MLRHDFVNGRPINTQLELVTRITLCLFPYMPEVDPEIPFIKDCGRGVFFCYQHQFQVEVEEFTGFWEFTPKLHCEYDKGDKIEMAIETLNPHLFRKYGRADVI